VRIIKKYSLIDTHCDTAAELLDKEETLEKNTCMIDVEMMNNFSSYIQIFAAWVSQKDMNPLLRAIDILDKAKTEIKNNGINLILNSSDLENTLKSKKHGAILAIEDARALCGKLSALQFFYDIGVRVITLSWNSDNDVCRGCLSPTKKGITEFGKKVIGKMNELNMIVDVSHISEQGFWDVLKITNAPVIASHSNCYSVCNHKRNLKDEQIRALINQGGMMSLNIYPDFLENEKNASIYSIIKHIDYALSIGAEKNLGFGADFDGINKTPHGFNSLRDYEKLINEMILCGYSDELIKGLTHRNFLNFMKRTENLK